MRLETEAGRKLDRALARVAAGLDARERAFAHELAYGVTRLRGRLDYLLAPHVRRGMESVDSTVLELLRVGAYQMFYMGSVPPYAAVSATVDQADAMVGGPRARFVNAVLRKVQAAGAGYDRFPDREADPTGFLTTWGSHPEWMVRRWLRRWSPDDLARLVEADNQAPPTYLAPLALTPAQAVARLAGDSIGASVVGEGSQCIRLEERGDVQRALASLPDAVVQDPAANLVTRYADVPSGTMVADLCAAPGGKALALSARRADILAVDRSESRIRMMRDNVRRTGRPVALVVADARHPPVSRADVVVLDVPCTGTGTFARHPDARWRLRPEAIEQLRRVQESFLEAAARLVPPGGLLVYSTCSLETEENADGVEAFMRRHPDFGVEASNVLDGRYVDDRGYLQVTPQQHGFDGAFAARLRRAG